MLPEESARRVVEVSLAVVVRDGRVLICRRPSHVALPGYWELPGGKREPGETPEAAAVRELAEETGLHGTAVARLSAVTHDYPHARVALTPVVCRAPAGDPRPLACDECRWITSAELPDYRFPPGNALLPAWVHTAALETSARPPHPPQPGDSLNQL